MIYVLDKKDNVVGVLSNKAPFSCPYFDDLHVENIETGVHYFDFSIPAAHKTAGKVENEGSVLLRDLDGKMQQFKIKTIEESNTSNGYIKLIKTEHIAISELLTDVVRPKNLHSVTPSVALNYVLDGTGYALGEVDFMGAVDVVFEEHITVLQAIYQIAELFEAELQFEVIFNRGKIRNKLVHMQAKRGTNTNKIFSYRKDLNEVTRTEDSEGLVTALVAVGKEGADGQPLTLTGFAYTRDGVHTDKEHDYVESDEALQTYGKNGKHIFGTFIDSEAVTQVELFMNAKDELNKRRKPKYTYECSVVTLERITGYEAEKVRIGDTVIIQDYSFNPPLLLEARILELSRSYTQPENDAVVLGDYAPIKLSKAPSIERLQASLNKTQNTVASIQEGFLNIDEKVTVINGKVTEMDGKVIIAADSAAEAAKKAESVVGSVAEVNSKVTVVTGEVAKVQCDIVNVQGKLDNAVTTIDRSGITVRDGNFGLETSEAGVHQTFVEGKLTNTKPFRNHILSLPNMLSDHSFELLKAIGAMDKKTETFAIEKASTEWGGWTTIGSPRIYSDYKSDNTFAFVPFAKQMICVNFLDYVRQSVDIEPNLTYTLSFHAKTPLGYNAASNIEVYYKFFETGGSAIGQTVYARFPAPVNDYGSKSIRHALTIHVPNQVSNYNAPYMQIGFRTTESNKWICIDGVQLVEGDKAILYQADDEAWKIRNENTEAVTTNKLDFNNTHYLTQATSTHLHLKNKAGGYGNLMVNKLYLENGFDSLYGKVHAEDSNAMAFYGLGASSSRWAIAQNSNVSVATGGASQAYTDMTFAKAYQNTATIVLGQTKNASSVSYNVGIYSITRTGCRVYIGHIHDAKASVNIAVQVLAIGI